MVRSTSLAKFLVYDNLNGPKLSNWKKRAGTIMYFFRKQGIYLWSNPWCCCRNVLINCVLAVGVQNKVFHEIKTKNQKTSYM